MLQTLHQPSRCLQHLPVLTASSGSVLINHGVFAAFLDPLLLGAAVSAWGMNTGRAETHPKGCQAQELCWRWLQSASINFALEITASSRAALGAPLLPSSPTSSRMPFPCATAHSHTHKSSLQILLLRLQ